MNKTGSVKNHRFFTDEFFVCKYCAYAQIRGLRQEWRFMIMELEKLQKIIAEVLSVDVDEISKDMSFYDDLGADSLELTQIIMGVEGEFDIIFDENIINDIDTVEDLEKLVSQQ